MISDSHLLYVCNANCTTITGDSGSSHIPRDGKTELTEACDVSPNAAYSVLKSHQAKNRKTCAPNSHVLSTVSPIQTSQAIQNAQMQPQHGRVQRVQPENTIPEMNEDIKSDEDLQFDNNSDEEPSPTARCAACNSQINNNGPGLKPTQMGFYHRAWADILEHSKRLYRLTLHTSPSAFPECNQAGLTEAHDCLFEAIAHYEETEG